MIFANVIVLWGSSSEEVQEQLNIRNNIVEKYGMKFSVEKSKTMVVTRGEREGKGNVKIRDVELEVVSSFKLTQDARLTNEISRRVQ